MSRKSAQSVKPVKPLSPDLMLLLKQAYALHQHGRIQEAQTLYQQLLQHRPDSPEANFLLGNLMFQVGQLDRAEPLLRQAVTVAPNDVRHVNALGVLLLRTGVYSEAEALFERATCLDPRGFDAWANLGAARIKLDRYELAQQALIEALKWRKTDSRALNNLGNAYLGLCQIDDSIKAYQAAFAVDPKLFSALSNALLNSHYLSALNPEQTFDMHRKAGQTFPVSDWQAPRSGKFKEKLRVGFLSGDFRTHSVAYFVLPLLEQMDRDRFELIGLYNDVRNDAMTQRFSELFDAWHSVASLPDPALLELLRQQNLDILIDLAGHTGNNRLTVLSQRVAPVQVNWLGYPHSTGIAAMDARIVDAITDPAPHSDRHATEQLIRLPHGFLCYQGDAALPVAEPPCLHNHYITFGSFNNLAKVTDEVLDVWIDILKRTPDSRLVLKAKQLGEESVRVRILRRFEQAGIESARLDLLARVATTASHLELYGRIDIALDTFPYNGTTTTCEALWMGVPVIAFAGDRHCARVSVSILEHAGLSAFVGLDLNDYKRLARDWARKPEALGQLRRELRTRLQKSDLGNAVQYAREMEAALSKLCPA